MHVLFNVEIRNAGDGVQSDHFVIFGGVPSEDQFQYRAFRTGIVFARTEFRSTYRATVSRCSSDWIGNVLNVSLSSKATTLQASKWCILKSLMKTGGHRFL